jgi:hypothetical protein
MSALRFSTASRVRPMEGLTACGDVIIDLRREGWHLLAVVDALGHGPDAAKSASAALQAAQESIGQPLERVFEAVHRALPKLRGVVMSALLLESTGASFAGVGNVEVFAPEGVSRPVAMAGTLGGAAYRYRSFAVALEPGHRWALVSDGIRAREGSVLFHKFRQTPAQEAADSLVAQAGRAHDDVAVLIIDVEAA